jgi:hypothetical protein
VIRDWGSSAAERSETWPCDEVLHRPDDALFRAVDVDAPVAVTYRWLCQLRMAPYSYDLLDNLGRRSPRTLTPGLEHLEVGQRFMTIFRLVSFEPDDHLTLRTRGVFGDVVVSYRVRPLDGGRTRLAVKLLVDHRRDLLGRVWRVVLPAGDLVMMRRQLLTLADLAASST